MFAPNPTKSVIRIILILGQPDFLVPNPLFSNIENLSANSSVSTAHTTSTKNMRCEKDLTSPGEPWEPSMSFTADRIEFEEACGEI
jgi:hypothetical protein